jgi:hypothetical protein
MHAAPQQKTGAAQGELRDMLTAKTAHRILPTGY